jgi:hypothetical protein
MLPQHTIHHCFNFSERPGRSNNSPTSTTGGLRTMVNQVFRALHVISVIKKLDPHISIDSEHSITRFVNLLKQRPVFYPKH